MSSTEEAAAVDLLRRTTYGRIALSRNALPCLMVARHIVTGDIVTGDIVTGDSVTGDSLLLRVHAGLGHHTACDGRVVAYEADNAAEERPEVWSVQLVGRARLTEPGAGELARLGPPAATADGVPFAPAYLRVEPRFVRVHRLAGIPRQRSA